MILTILLIMLGLSFWFAVCVSKADKKEDMERQAMESEMPGIYLKDDEWRSACPEKLEPRG